MRSAWSRGGLWTGAKRIRRGEGEGEGEGRETENKKTKKEGGEAYLSRPSMLGNMFLLNRIELSCT